MAHYVLRITQLDAFELDKEIVKLLKDQVQNAYQYFPIGLATKWKDEIDSLLEVFIWKYSVNKEWATFGQQLLNIRYKGNYDQKKAYLYAFLTIGLNYFKKKTYKIKNDKISNIFHYIELATKICSLLNLLYFFQEAKYPRLIERILSLELGSSTLARRTVGYEYMLRELIWNSLMELLLYIVPLINYHVVKRKLKSLFNWNKSKTEMNLSRIANFTLETRCPVCSNRPNMPHVMGCSHIFCYYCLKSNILADPKYECPLCGYVLENEELLRPYIVIV